MSENPVPVPNATRPYWRRDLHPLDSHQSSETLPAEQDIVIIGAGYAGAALAYYLLDGVEESSRPAITILEAREACSGATARNGGHVRPDLYAGLPARIKRFGQEAADEMALFELANLHGVRDLVREKKIDCDFRVTTSMAVIRDEKLAKPLKDGLDELLRLGSPTAKLVHYVEGKAAEVFSGVKGAMAAFAFEAGSIWPYKLVLYLLSQAVDKGAQLHTHTPVTEVSDSREDGFWIVTTPRGIIKAKTVLYASNGYTSTLLPEYKNRIIPVRGVCSHVAVPEGGAPPPYLPTTYSLRHGANLYDYQVTRPDGSIVVGGARTEVIPHVEEWYNVWDDSKMIEPAAHYFDDHMQRNFRGWEDSGAEVDSIWTGIMGYTNDLYPHVGPVPSKPGQFVCAGFNGHGMSFILLTARGLAKIVRDGVPFSQSGVPRLFETSESRLRRDENELLA
ncbi:FAD dependent oxidoreductase [Colletotrichum higginsianum]|uniref:FAD dependent oxidoreductase n=2 Tax=Colletotrichum higginsianum TaxID=80884 RepID=H1VNL4_COLHI|nr:FAD dependent oxidoreductase [Colletotrichum higginsianum IMI 349063]OBR09693.1 FAD dependent oxidoreductase [Colletotrichum higginsianum IMI 349063]TID06135.1 Gamma-glutamylputrescine oxidoreductase [Colletotrichum higginsianum]CCF41818.1 FAD dependent oxidoreductase [Colletotrichum higginsianum]